MKLKSIVFLGALFVVLVAASAAFAGDFNYIEAEQVKTMIEKGHPMHLVDIQVEEEFNDHHIKGAIKTTAYPVKSDEDKAKLEDVTAKAKQDKNPVVIICPRGKGGAERTYNYMKDNGIAEERLLILEDGQAGWPYPELLEK